QAAGWAKVLALGNDGWIALSCEQATPFNPNGTCGAVSYRTAWRELAAPNGEWAGDAWNGAATVGRHALGWMSWRPQNYGGVTTTWNPQPVCTVSGDACSANDDCAVLGELCCRGGAPCGQCRGFTDACATHAACPAGDLCCPAGVPCGRCVSTGVACGSDSACTLRDLTTPAGEDSCCPPGAVCTRMEELAPGETPQTVGTLPGAMGFCGSIVVPEEPHALCMERAQCSELCAQEPPRGLCVGNEGQICTGDADCASDACSFEVGICDANASDDVGNSWTVPCLGGDASSYCDVATGNASAACRNIIGICADDTPQRLCVDDANCAIGFCEKLYLPWLQTQFGPVYSGGSIGNPQTAPPPSGQFNATYCVLAGGPIVNFLSEEGCSDVAQTPYGIPPTGRSARIDVNGILRGRYGTLATTPPSGDTSTPWTTDTDGFLLDESVNLVDFTSTTIPISDRIYVIGGAGVAFRNGVGDQSGSGLIVIRGGDLRISGNITYADSGPLLQVRHLASPGWLVLADENGNGGNIIVDPGVTELSGAFYAQGTIRTGTTGNGATEKALRVHGVMIARQFAFERTLAKHISTSAEQVIADGRVLVNTPPGFGDIAQSLPRIHQVVPQLEIP
ncbi:MAG: hypothetical protein Q7T01_00855, partial [bacterium]|nr:hypothetical protein [bacterium]